MATLVTLIRSWVGALCLLGLPALVLSSGDTIAQDLPPVGSPSVIDGSSPEAPSPLDGRSRRTPSPQVQSAASDSDFEDLVRRALDGAAPPPAPEAPVPAPVSPPAVSSPSVEPVAPPRPYTPPVRSPVAQPDATSPVAVAPQATISPAAGGATVLANVNLRSGPSTDSAVIGTLRAGETIAVIGCVEWCEVETGIGRGFVYRRFVENR